MSKKIQDIFTSSVNPPEIDSIEYRVCEDKLKIVFNKSLEKVDLCKFIIRDIQIPTPVLNLKVESIAS